MLLVLLILFGSIKNVEGKLKLCKIEQNEVKLCLGRYIRVYFYLLNHAGQS